MRIAPLRFRARSAVLSAFLALTCSMALAQTGDKPLADQGLETRVLHLANELRCLVCQNQTIADSNADLAVDLRNEVRKQVSSGRSDREIVDFMVARYGEFVLYRPPVRAGTVLLWAGPFLLLALGLTVLVVHVRRRRRAASGPLPAAQAAADAETTAKVTELLSDPVDRERG